MKKSIIIAGLILITIPTKTIGAERLSLGYIYNSSISHSQIIENTRDSINVVSPTCFDINSNGQLEINNLLNKDFVDEMHSKGIRVTPFLSNHWGQKRAEKMLDNPHKIINDLVNVINVYGLDGVNVDIENISVSYKDKLTNFVKLLREALNEEKTISVAVAANPERLEKTWLAAYDYKGLSLYSDYLVLMAYDEHSYGGAEGPVASIGYVKKSLEYILESVSKDKIILGIPLYGRIWEVGSEYGGEAIVIGQVENLIRKYRLVPNFDTKEMTPKLTIDIDGTKQNAYVNGRYLEEGTYNIWYENESSIKEKLKLVNEYNILGTALWALDGEGKEFWNYYKNYLNETEYESEKEIRIRERLDAYSKIINVKPIKITPIIVTHKNQFLINDKMRNNILNNIEMIKTYEYETIECIFQERKIKPAKTEKIKIRGVVKIFNREQEVA